VLRAKPETDIDLLSFPRGKPKPMNKGFFTTKTGKTVEYNLNPIGSLQVGMLYIVTIERQ